VNNLLKHHGAGPMHLHWLKASPEHSIRLGLGLRLGLRLGSGLGFRFTLCVYYVFTKPSTEFSSCVAVMLQDVVK